MAPLHFNLRKNRKLAVKASIYVSYLTTINHVVDTSHYVWWEHDLCFHIMKELKITEQNHKNTKIILIHNLRILKNKEKRIKNLVDPSTLL